MKRITFLLSTILISFTPLHLFSQNGGIYLSLQQNEDVLFFQDKYSETELSVGAKVPVKRGALYFMISYQYGGNWKVDSVQGYKLDYHLLGGAIKYRFFNNNKIYSPTLKISFLTELFSNYRGKGIGIGSHEGVYPTFLPQEEILPIFQLSYENYGKDKLLYYQSYDYISTPIVGSIFFGNEFRIFEGLYVNVELGYLFRAVRTNHKKWLPDDQEPKTKIVETHRIKNSSNGETSFIHYLSFGIGINYTFPFHKEKQPE